MPKYEYRISKPETIHKFQIQKIKNIRMKPIMVHRPHYHFGPARLIRGFVAVKPGKETVRGFGRGAGFQASSAMGHAVSLRHADQEAGILKEVPVAESGMPQMIDQDTTNHVDLRVEIHRRTRRLEAVDQTGI